MTLNVTWHVSATHLAYLFLNMLSVPQLLAILYIHNVITLLNKMYWYTEWTLVSECVQYMLTPVFCLWGLQFCIFLSGCYMCGLKVFCKLYFFFTLHVKTNSQLLLHVLLNTWEIVYLIHKLFYLILFDSGSASDMEHLSCKWQESL